MRGGANHNAPAVGDYDAQGQTRIVGHYLLTADIGANMVSVFRIDRPTGALTFVANVSLAREQAGLDHGDARAGPARQILGGSRQSVGPADGDL